jgi:hypothetical protein
MRSPLEIKQYIEEKMRSMLTRPQMYATDLTGLEIEYLGLFSIVLYIEGREDIVRNNWSKFCYDTMGYTGPFLAGEQLKKNEKLDEDSKWKVMTNLLGAFRRHVNQE